MIFKKNEIDFLFDSEPTSKALNRMVSSNSASQADEPSERANQMIMVRISRVFIFLIV